MSKTKAIYDALTGQIVKHFSGRDSQLARNIPEGCLSTDGDFDPLSQRINVATGEVIDYRPPQPSDEHEWTDRRWKLKPEIARARAAIAAALTQIAAIEQSQQRAVRELAIDPTNATARAKLIETDARIAQLRDVLMTNRKVNSIG